MSHYSVLVITDSEPTGAQLKKIMQPWHEYECTGVKDRYVKFVDETEEVEETWNTHTTTRYRLASGEIVDGEDPRLFRRATPADEKRAGIIIDCYGGPFGRTKTIKGSPHVRDLEHANAVEVQVPLREIYKSKDELARKWCGYRKHRGKYGRWTNPDKKWDWWVIGGRYAGRLIGPDGKPADQLPVGSICFEAMQRKVRSAVRGYVDEALKDGDREANLKVWRDQAAVNQATLAEWKAKGRPGKYAAYLSSLPESHPVRLARDLGLFEKLGDWGVGVPETEPDPYAWADSRPEITCWAVVKDGQWSEKGQMGWFGMSIGDKDHRDWEQEVVNLVRGLRPEQWITVLDCHI